jgi:hypothetical protein
MASALTARPQSLNRYSYVINSPLCLTDPSGLSPACPVEGSCDDSPVQAQSKTGQQGPVTPNPVIIDIGEPPPPLVHSVKVEAPSPREFTNEPLSDGTYFTGVASVLKITPQDAAGNPITGVFVAESVFSASGSNVRQRTERIPVGPDGSFTDLVGLGRQPSPTTPLSTQEATSVLNRIAERPTNQETVQVLTFYAKEGYVIGTALYSRSFRNLDSAGNITQSKDANTGGRMVNYTISVTPARVFPPQ